MIKKLKIDRKHNLTIIIASKFVIIPYNLISF